VVFNIFEDMRHRNENPQCYRVDVIDGLVDEITQEETSAQPLERVMANSIECGDKDTDEEIDESVQKLNASKVESASRKVEALEVIVAKGVENVKGVEVIKT